MELISIISYSLVILITLLVVFVLLSYLVSSIKKRKDTAITRAAYNFKPVERDIRTPVMDKIKIRKEVDNYYNNREEEFNIEENIVNKEIIQEKEEETVQKAYNRYLVLNYNLVAEKPVLTRNYSIGIENFSNNYEDSDEGVYYNIKIGA